MAFEAAGAAQPSVAVDARESFVLTWQHRHEGVHSLHYALIDRTREEIRDIAWVRRDARGRWSEPRQAHGDGWRIAGCPVNGPALAANGRAVLALWPTLATEPMRVRARLGDAKGFAAPFELDEHAGVLGRVDVEPWSKGGFLVSWIGAQADGPTLMLAQLDRQARVVERKPVQATDAGRSSGNPRMATSNGRALIAWPVSGGIRVALIAAGN